MNVERETILQFAVSTAVVAVFIVGAVVVGLNYRTNGSLEPTGGTALVGTIVAFVLVMMAAGLWLERAS
ncbi:MAG: hypothetical protein ABEH35_04070 [Haloarculaceae archaeon]